MTLMHGDHQVFVDYFLVAVAPARLAFSKSRVVGRGWTNDLREIVYVVVVGDQDQLARSGGDSIGRPMEL
jgi:hypothetical protein